MRANHLRGQIRRVAADRADRAAFLQRQREQLPGVPVVLALDSLWMCTMLLALLLVIAHGSLVYFEAALLIALLGFVSTIALAKFLMRGEVIE